VSSSVLILGSTGALGSAIRAQFELAQWHIFTADRGYEAGPGQLPLPLDRESLPQYLPTESLDAVVFAQGANSNGSLLTETDEKIAELLDANCLFIIRAMRELVNANAIKAGGRVVVLTSIWEQFTRQEKLAYTVSKAAAGGLVRSLAFELAPRHIWVNALLPGVIDSPMTRTNLGPEKLAKIQADSPSGELATADDVGRAALWLASPLNTGITGQSIFLDRGYTTGRVI
jgi:3-oxoacyl-[acyl-carrier protein] reductase